MEQKADHRVARSLRVKFTVVKYCVFSLFIPFLARRLHVSWQRFNEGAVARSTIWVLLLGVVPWLGPSMRWHRGRKARRSALSNIFSSFFMGLPLSQKEPQGEDDFVDMSGRFVWCWWYARPPRIPLQEGVSSVALAKAWLLWTSMISVRSGTR